MNRIARTPKAPYYAVIFTSIRTPIDEGYPEIARRIVELAEKQKGFLGVESVRDEDFGITISYWDSLKSIDDWKRNLDHQNAKKMGRSDWYRGYHLRIARIEWESIFQKEP